VKELDKKARGKADATSCHKMDATIVVMMAPSRPVLKKPCMLLETLNIFSSSSAILRVVTRAMKNMQDTTQSCRPIINPERLLPSPLNRSLQVFKANVASPVEPPRTCVPHAGNRPFLPLPMRSTPWVPQYWHTNSSRPVEGPAWHPILVPDDDFYSFHAQRASSCHETNGTARRILSPALSAIWSDYCCAATFDSCLILLMRSLVSKS
jgi:hypothetical protein